MDPKHFVIKGLHHFGMQGECWLKDISKCFDNCFDCEEMLLIPTLYKPGKITCFDISIDYLNGSLDFTCELSTR